MTRKRFTKLLMGIGFQRNEANSYAHLKPDYLSYKRYWNFYYQWVRYMGELINGEVVLRNLNYLELHKYGR